MRLTNHFHKKKKKNIFLKFFTPTSSSANSLRHNFRRFSSHIRFLQHFISRFECFQCFIYFCQNYLDTQLCRYITHLHKTIINNERIKNRKSTCQSTHRTRRNGCRHFTFGTRLSRCQCWRHRRYLISRSRRHL